MLSFALIVVFASLVEATVEYVTQPIAAVYALPSYAKPYAAMAVGVLASCYYGVNLLTILAALLAQQGIVLAVPAYDWLGFVLTGLIIGRGSNVANDLISRLRGASAAPTATL